MKILMALLAFGLLFVAGCALFGQKVVRVNDQGNLIDADGKELQGSDGKPIHVPEGSINTLGGLLAVAGVTVGLRTLGGVASALPPPWSMIATFLFGGTGLIKKAVEPAPAPPKV